MVSVEDAWALPFKRGIFCEGEGGLRSKKWSVTGQEGRGARNSAGSRSDEVRGTMMAIMQLIISVTVACIACVCASSLHGRP